MESSKGLTARIDEKIAKIEEFLKREGSPQHVEFHLKSHPTHAHQEVSIHLETKKLSLTAKAENADMYKAIDQASEKLISEIKKKKDSLADKQDRVAKEKGGFYETEE
jgi:ribosomal subunit interface protein